METSLSVRNVICFPRHLLSHEFFTLLTVYCVFNLLLVLLDHFINEMYSEQKNWPEGYQLSSAMNFKFPQFSCIPMETIVPNGSPECAVLLSHLLHWNPSKRPTTSAALKYPYFAKCQPIQQQQQQRPHLNGIQQQKLPVQQPKVTSQAMKSVSNQNPSVSSKPTTLKTKENDKEEEGKEDKRVNSKDWRQDLFPQQSTQVRRRSMGLKGSATFTELSSFQSRNPLPAEFHHHEEEEDTDLGYSTSKFNMNSKQRPNSRTPGNSTDNKSRTSGLSVKDQNLTRFAPGKQSSRSPCQYH